MLGPTGVLRHRFAILQGTGTKRTRRTLSDSNVVELQICGAKPCVPLFTEGNDSCNNLASLSDYLPVTVVWLMTFSPLCISDNLAGKGVL